METKENHLCLLGILLFQRKDHLTRSVLCVRESTGGGRCMTSWIFSCSGGWVWKGGRLSWRIVIKMAMSVMFLFFSLPSLWPSPFHWCLYCLQGLIFLQGNQVNELPPNPDEPGKHLFEIVPGRPLFPCTFSVTSPYFNQLSLMVIGLCLLLSILMCHPDYLERLGNGTWQTTQCSLFWI